MRYRPQSTDPKDWLSYDPATGAITWKRRQRGLAHKREGRAGSPQNMGYVQIMVCKKNYLAHRLAWYLYHGEWPAQQIDHINGNRTDNRLVNLRLATQTQNAMNRGPSRKNASGHKGVTFDGARGKWRAQISENGRNRLIGRYDNLEDAVAAYAAEAKRIHGPFTWRPE